MGRLPVTNHLDEALDYSQRWIDIIHKTSVSEAEAKAIIEESKYNFAEHFNKGWLEYRKSVTEAGDWAAIGMDRQRGDLSAISWGVNISTAWAVTGCWTWAGRIRRWSRRCAPSSDARRCPARS